MAVISLVILAVLGPGGSDPDPTTSTTLTVPDSPAPGLALQPEPAAPSPADPPLDSPGPVPAVPGGGAALTAMVAGLAVLAGRARRISNAEHSIRASLQDSLFSDVGHDDLADIASVIGTLGPGEASEVVARLSDREIGVWMRELDGWLGGFSHDEQARLFRDLAARLDPGQLRRVIAESGKAGLFDAAVADSPPAVRVRLAVMLWGSQSPADPGWERIGQLVAEVPSRQLEAGLAHIPVASLAQDLLGRHHVEPDGAARLRLDAMVGVIGRAATFTDPDLKGQLFVEMARQAIAHRSTPAAGESDYEDVLGRLSTLLRSDLGPIVGRLNHDLDPHGNVLSEWIEEMIGADRIDELDVLLAGLVGGDRRLDHFADPGSDPAFPYPNAANLGYYIGAYSLAIEAIAEDAADRVTLVGRLFSIVTGVVPGPGDSKIRLPIGPLVDAHAESVVDGLRDEASSLKQALWGLAKPRTRHGLLWNGAGTTQFQDAWEEVVLVR